MLPCPCLAVYVTRKSNPSINMISITFYQIVSVAIPFRNTTMSSLRQATLSRYCLAVVIQGILADITVRDLSGKYLPLYRHFYLKEKAGINSSGKQYSDVKIFS